MKKVLLAQTNCEEQDSAIMLKLVISFLEHPKSLQRQIAKTYEDTLIIQTFTFDGNNTFSLERAVSMDPIEKLKVTINDAIQQHFL